MENEQVDTSVLDKYLNPEGEVAEVSGPAPVEAGQCWNCANNGAKQKLDKEGVCPKCGYTEPRSN